MPDLPAITGRQLIRLLKADGWTVGRRTNHGISFSKADEARNRVTIVPDKRSTLPSGTLGAILGPKQTNIGREGLERLLLQYGLR